MKAAPCDIGARVGMYWGLPRAKPLRLLSSALNTPRRKINDAAPAEPLLGQTSRGCQAGGCGRRWGFPVGQLPMIGRAGNCATQARLPNLKPLQHVPKYGQRLVRLRGTDDPSKGRKLDKNGREPTHPLTPLPAHFQDLRETLRVNFPIARRWTPSILATPPARPMAANRIPIWKYPHSRIASPCRIVLYGDDALSGKRSAAGRLLQNRL